MVLNRMRRGQLITAPAVPIVAPAIPVATSIIPILVSSSDLEDFDDLAFVQPQPVGEDMIAHLYSKGGGSDTIFGEVNMATRFKRLRQNMT